MPFTNIVDIYYKTALWINKKIINFVKSKFN